MGVGKALAAHLLGLGIRIARRRRRRAFLCRWLLLAHSLKLLDHDLEVAGDGEGQERDQAQD